MESCGIMWRTSLNCFSIFRHGVLTRCVDYDVEVSSGNTLPPRETKPEKCAWKSLLLQRAAIPKPRRAEVAIKPRFLLLQEESWWFNFALQFGSSLFLAADDDNHALGRTMHSSSVMKEKIVHRRCAASCIVCLFTIVQCFFECRDCSRNLCQSTE